MFTVMCLLEHSRGYYKVVFFVRFIFSQDTSLHIIFSIVSSS